MRARLGWTDEVEQLHPLADEAAATAFPARPFDLAMSSRVMGMAAAALGRRDDAVRHYETALALVESWPNHFDDPQVRHRYGECLLASGDAGDRERARALLAAAVDGYRRLGMELLLPEAERLLRSLD